MNLDSMQDLTTTPNIALSYGTLASSCSRLIISFNDSRYARMRTVRLICYCRNCSATANISTPSTITEVVPSPPSRPGFRAIIIILFVTGCWNVISSRVIFLSLVITILTIWSISMAACNPIQ